MNKITVFMIHRFILRYKELQVSVIQQVQQTEWAIAN